MLPTSPLTTSDFPSIQSYRLNVLALATLNGLDVARLEAYRRAVQASFYTDEVKA